VSRFALTGSPPLHETKRPKSTSLYVTTGPMSSTFFPCRPIFFPRWTLCARVTKGGRKKMTFGKRLKELREVHNLDRYALASRLGVSYWTVAKYESGERS